MGVRIFAMALFTPVSASWDLSKIARPHSKNVGLAQQPMRKDVEWVTVVSARWR